MSSNYPPGAENDTRAPWNEEPEREIPVTVRYELVKETVVFGSVGHMVREYEYDPDEGRAVGVAHWESSDDPKELFAEQKRSPLEIMQCCIDICRQLQKEGHWRYGGHLLSGLIADCEDWEEGELRIKS